MSLVLDIKKANYSLKEGVHLVALCEIKLLRDTDGKVSLYNGTENAILARFENKKGFFEYIYYVGGKSQWLFDKTVSHMGIDNRQGPVSKKEAIGKRIFIAVRRNQYVMPGGIMEVDQQGNPVYTYSIFKTFPCIDPEKKPSVLGDPEKNNGIPSDDFVCYILVNNFIDRRLITEEEAGLHSGSIASVVPQNSNPNDLTLPDW